MDDQVCHIDKLPDHLLVQIFDHLVLLWIGPELSRPFPEITLLHIVGLVNRRWNVLALSPQLWRQFYRSFKRSNTFSPKFSSFLHRIAPAIENLQIGIDSNLFPNLFSQFPSLPNVTRLWVESYPTITPADVDSMVKFCPNVTSAYFDVNNLSDEHLQLFASGWKKLVEVNISGNRKMTAAVLIDFVSAVNPLRSISINDIGSLTDSDIEEITGVLGKSLKSISFGFNQENLSGSAIYAIVRNCLQLEEICIMKLMNIGYLKNLISLRKLTINPIQDDPGVIESFADCFCRPFAHLRYLTIKNVKNLSDSILNLIANSCPLLETFILWGRGNRAVTDAGMSEIFAKCRRLTVLTLVGFPCLTGRSFVGGRQTLPNLTVFNVRRCRNVDVNVLRTEFADVKGMKIYRGEEEILNN